jgi:hypothetical protein
VPGVRLKAVGLAVTPVGSPLTVTLTVPVNPFCAVAVTLTGAAPPPGVKVIVAGEDVSEKSGFGVGAPLLPQDVKTRQKRRKKTAQTLLNIGGPSSIMVASVTWQRVPCREFGRAQ